jgi:Tol biopolymer transport system component
MMSSLLSPRLGFVVLAAILVPLVFGSVADGAVPNFKGSSADGSIVFFETEEQLVPGDTDTKRDVYERSFDKDVVAGGAYVTREASLGPAGGNDAYPAQFEGSDDAGDLVFFSTEERLIAEDTDRSSDVYVRDLADGSTELVTQGASSCAPGCGSKAFAALFAGADAEGNRVFFETKEQLSGADADTSTDLYVRDLMAGETELVSSGETGCLPGCGNGGFEVSRRGISSDGSFAYFITAEPLSSADGDVAADIYARDLEGGVTSLVSTGSCAGCGDGGAVPIFNGSSADGSRVFFSSEEKLVGADGDKATDVYARDLPAGPTILVSEGSEDVTASFSAASSDGSHVFFTSAEDLLEADEDGVNDIYEWIGGTLKLITSAPCSSLCGANFDAVSADSTEVVFSTAGALVPADKDTSDDIYRQAVAGGSPVLVSRGEDSCPSCWEGEADARFNQASADASRVVFTTVEGVLAEDQDGEDDIYLRDAEAGSSSLITIAPSYCPLKKGNCGATFVGSSEDGLHVFFRTVERFTLEDGDNEADVYERFLGEDPSQEVTRLVSTGNDPNLDLGPAAPELTGTDPESPSAATTLRILGEATGSAVKIYTSEDCAGEPVATGTAAALTDPGLQVTVLVNSLTTFRATAEAEGFVSDCSQPLTYQNLPEAKAPGGEVVVDEAVDQAPAVEGQVVVAPPGPEFLAPHTRITFAPASKTRSRSPVFRFTDSTGQSGTTFQCKVDRKPWRRCRSPLHLKRLSRGKHVVEVKAINGAGQIEPRPVKRVFKVVPR